MASAKVSKDEENLQELFDKIGAMPDHVRGTMLRMHEVIMEAAPVLKPRIWYGMPGYAKAASSPVLIFFRNDELMSLGISEKAKLQPAGGKDGLLMPCAWYFEDLDEATETRVAEIVRGALAD